MSDAAEAHERYATIEDLAAVETELEAFESVLEQEADSADFRLRTITEDVRTLELVTVTKFKQLMESNANIERHLLDISKQLTLALNNVDGLGVQRRLSAVEETLAKRPVRRKARK